MNKLIVAFLFLIISCEHSPSFQTTPSGIQYKLFRAKSDGTAATRMSTVKVVEGSKVSDSLHSYPPLYKVVMPPAPYISDPLAEVLMTGQVREGDSIFIVDIDKKEYAYRIHTVFVPNFVENNTDSIINADKNGEIALMNEKQFYYAEQRLNRYFERNNITAVRDNNVFLNIINRGTPPLALKGKTAGIKYTSSYVHTGKIINSNKDTSFSRQSVLYFKVGDHTMLKQVNRVLPELGVGAHVQIFIPAIVVLGLGAYDPDADLTGDMLFELEVVAVRD